MFEAEPICGVVRGVLILVEGSHIDLLICGHDYLLITERE